MRTSYYGDKLALLTGASQGIGKALAQELVSCGAGVVICARDEEKLRAAVSDIRERCRRPDQLVAQRTVDVVDYETTHRGMKAIVDQYGRPDFLMNCAGFAHPGYLDQLDPAVLREMMEVNYLGTVHVCKAALAHLKDGQSHILNVASMAGFVGLFGNAGYCASKYAVIGFSEALRSELSPRRIKVSVLCPPNTRTPGLRRENRVKPAEVLAIEDRAAVLEAADVAVAALKALPKGRFLIHPNIRGRAAYLLSRFMPGLLRQLTKRPPLRPRSGSS